jgi:type IV pilus assembly protein PilN
MAKINLLPWREELRKQRQQDFLIVMGLSVFATCVLFGLVYMYIEGLKEYQQQRNNRLQEEITKVEKKLEQIKDIEDKKNALIKKIDLIQKLQESRPEIVHVFDELRKITPVGIYLTNVEQKDRNITITGKSEANARVSEYMKAIDSSQYLTTPTLKYVKGLGTTPQVKDQLSDFILQVKQKDKKPVDEKATEKKPEAPAGAK